MVELAKDAGHSVGKGFVSVFGSKSAGTAEGESGAKNGSASRPSTNASSRGEAPGSEPSGPRLSDEVSNYAAHTAADEDSEEFEVSLLANKEFWKAFGAELGGMVADELVELECMNPEARASAMCAFLASWAVPVKSVKAVWMLAKATKAGKMGKVGQLRKIMGPAAFDKAIKATRIKIRS